MHDTCYNVLLYIQKVSDWYILAMSYKPLGFQRFFNSWQRGKLDSLTCLSLRDWFQRSCLNFLYFGACASLPLQFTETRAKTTCDKCKCADGTWQRKYKHKDLTEPEKSRELLLQTSSTWWECETGYGFNLFADDGTPGGGEHEEGHLPAEHGRGELQAKSKPPRSIWRVFAVQVTPLLQLYF